MPRFIEIADPAPILNTADFRWAFGGTDGRQIPRNPQGHPLHYEFVALPGMIFAVVKQISSYILRIRSPIYPSGPLYLDSRFTRPASTLASAVLPWPTINDLTEKMAKFLGAAYVWGGNWSAGIAELFSFYPPSGSLDDETKRLWTLRGVDCSGLLFEVSHGRTPRNTSQLIHFGKTILAEGKTPRQILPLLRPMDIVVWPGHVWFVLDSISSIESKSSFGVIRKQLQERLEETCLDRRCVDEWKEGLDPAKHFTIRRFL